MDLAMLLNPPSQAFPHKARISGREDLPPPHILILRQLPAFERNCKMTADSFASFDSEECVRACVEKNAVEMLKRLIMSGWMSGKPAEKRRVLVTC